jgi:hypothetical protein
MTKATPVLCKECNPMVHNRHGLFAHLATLIKFVMMQHSRTSLRVRIFGLHIVVVLPGLGLMGASLCVKVMA